MQTVPCGIAFITVIYGQVQVSMRWFDDSSSIDQKQGRAEGQI